MHVSALALPDIQRCTPVAVTADAPVLNILDPVSETAFSDTLRNPVDRVIVRDQVVPYRCHLDEPGFTRIVNKRRVASPAVRIAVFKLRRVEKQSSAVQILQHFRICFLYKQSCKRRGLRHVSFFIYKLYERKTVFSSYIRIIFTECRRNVNNTGTVCQCNICVAGHIKRFLVLLRSRICRALIKRLIFLALKIGSLVCLKDLICRLSFFTQLSKHGIKKRACHIVNISVCCLYLCVIFIRIYTESQVGRQRPRCGGPCQDIGVFVFYLKSHNRGTLFYIFVALSYFLGGQRRTAARAVRNDLKSFIEQAFIPDLL